MKTKCFVSIALLLCVLFAASAFSADLVSINFDELSGGSSLETNHYESLGVNFYSLNGGEAYIFDFGVHPSVYEDPNGGTFSLPNAIVGSVPASTGIQAVFASNATHVHVGVSSGPGSDTLSSDVSLLAYDDLDNLVAVDNADSAAQFDVLSVNAPEIAKVEILAGDNLDAFDDFTFGTVAPIVEFSADLTTGEAPLTVGFTDESTGFPDSWEWDFGDNSPLSNDQNPSHNYNTPGTYTVSLTVTSPGGTDTETKSDYITVEHPPPVADFSADGMTGVYPLTVNFTDQSTGEITSRSWDFGDDSTSTKKNPSHTYDDPGTYSVSLTCTGPGGSYTETKNDYIVVDYITPIANFVADSTKGVIPFTVNFTDKSTGDITGWLWDFGDEGTSTEQNPTHIYTEEGNYTVTLAVTGPESLDTETKTDYTVAYEELTVTNPNGGEIISSGSYYTVEWVAPFIADSFRLMLSTNNGKAWKKIDKGIIDTSYGWDVPTPKQNQTKCLVKVQAYDSNGDKIGIDQSDSAFTIEVLTITSPEEGEPLTARSGYTIEWDTNETLKPVDKVYLKYSENGGKTWKTIVKIVGDNPGQYLWTVAHVKETKNKCMIKVVLKNANNKIAAKGVSDGFFTIEP